MGAWTGLIWLRTGTCGRHLLMQWWTFGFHKMWGISWLAENGLASQEEVRVNPVPTSFCPRLQSTSASPDNKTLTAVRLKTFKEGMCVIIWSLPVCETRNLHYLLHRKGCAIILQAASSVTTLHNFRWPYQQRSCRTDRLDKTPHVFVWNPSASHARIFTTAKKCIQPDLRQVTSYRFA
jgi:hypothetical protein